MNNKALMSLVLSCSVVAGCERTAPKSREITSDIPNAVTADIQAGIETHIAEQTRLGDGYMRLPFEGRELQLKLVRVHTEYLANLGARTYFACVDLAGTDGEVYDVDFFMTGGPGAMTVTETTVHKINGQPLYVWEQKRDRTWVRRPYKDAPPPLLGVKTGRDEFEFFYKAELPEISEPARMWLPLPETDEFQIVEIKSIHASGAQKVLREQQNGNRVLFLELSPQDSAKTVEVVFGVKRLEKTVYKAPETDLGQYLKSAQLVPVTQNFRVIADEVVKGKDGDLVRARALYDHVIDRMRYIKYGDGWGKGDAVYACDARTGNCTDFHSYFIALARSVGIPARFAIGAAIPSSRDDGGISGYHCWAEFYSDGRWWPVDISEADKCSVLSTYYFGHHPANRIEFSRGRDLVVEPGPVSGPINFLAYPVLEIGGKPAKVKTHFSFKRTR
ncbi:transglutaminase-like domain-containing protein [Verrucomicrobiota bacterium]